MSDRVDRLAALLPSRQLDLLLITALVNVRYMTGYTGSNGLALVGAQTRVFVTDFRYVEQAKVEVHGDFERKQDQLELYGGLAASLPAGDEIRLGFDDANITVRQHSRLRELLPDHVQLVPAGGLVEELRAVKEANEIDSIRRAAKAADAGLARVLEQGLVGRTERELADALEHAMRENGADRPGFELIVAAGPHGALPHAQPRDAAVKRGEMVVIDWGAEVDGYRSDCTRTIAAGEPSAEAREVHELVLAAEQAGVQAVRSGTRGRDVDAVARAVIEAGGHGDHFGHGLGHGVGVEIHEAPRLSMRSDDRLVTGNVVTVEPGVYLAGRFGVRIEDLVVVDDGGCEILTSLARQLMVAD
jgi:Xaa-Pro aminopeptidase